MDNYIIIGTGSQAKVAAGILLANSQPILGFIEVNEYIPSNEKILDYPVLGSLDYLVSLKNQQEGYPQSLKFVLGIGDNQLRSQITNKLLTMISATSLTSLIHPTAYIESHTQIGNMSTLCLGSYLAINASVGQGAIINSGAIVEHDCIIGDFAHISVGVRLAGNVQVGDFTFVGIGATIKERVKVGKHVMIGAGAVVLEDIPDYAVAVGIPAKIKKILPSDMLTNKY